MEFSGAVSLQVLIQKSLKTLVTLEEKLHTRLSIIPGLFKFSSPRDFQGL